MTISKEKKRAYFERFQGYLANFTKAFIVDCDNVGSLQMQKIRAALRDKATVVMGKNTLMRKAIGMFLADNPDHPIGKITGKIAGNVGLVFCNGDLGAVREVIDAEVRPAPARAGAIAPCDVIVPKGPTGCDPGQTSFFQALNVATKIARGQIEIINDVKIMESGEKVSPGTAALLQKLGINPFEYGLKIQHVYDNGSLFSAAVLDITQDDIVKKFFSAVRLTAAISLRVGYPTIASLPVSIRNAFRHLVAVAVADGVDYDFDEAKPFKDYLADPSAFAVEAAPAEDAADQAAAEEEEEEESDAEGGVGGLFGGSDDDDDSDW